jgi:hypothetical protein
MKKVLSLVMGALILFGISCSKSTDSPAPPAPPVGDTVNVFIRGIISASQNWSKNKTYHLRGYIYVTNGATITIEPGTKIISNNDSAGVLVIHKGAKIMADANADNPIVFTSGETSPKAGDLGGIILVGNATGNGNHKVIEGGVDLQFSSFGGNKDDDNSGILRYVRIEYAGKAVNPGDEVNGLSLYGVGNGTTIDYVEVVRGLDDAFEFFGGSVNCKHLIAYNCADDDYDMDDGYHGKIQFAISVKDPAFTDAKGNTGDISNNFEVDNVNPANGLPFAQAPITYPTLSNFTAIGPNGAANTSIDYGYGMRWRRGAKFILANSIVMGSQKAGLVIESDSTASYYKSSTVAKFYNSFLNAVANPFRVASLTVNPAILDSATLANVTTTTDSSKYYANAGDIQLNDPFNNASPNLQPKAGSPALTTAGKFSAGNLSDAFFTPTSYIGALDGTLDWTAKWAVWGK